MGQLDNLSPLPPYPLSLFDEVAGHATLSPATDQEHDEVEWEPHEGCIYRDLHGRYLLVLTSDIDKLLVEFVDGTTRVIDIFQWRDLQPVIVLPGDRCHRITDG